MDAELLRKMQDRGRFFYEGFPGAAAAEEWTRARDKAVREYDARAEQDAESARTEDARTRLPARH
jgi:hypothetical protein